MCAIAGLVPDEMVQCLATFLDFCYFARRSEHDTDTLAVMDDALHRFHELRVVFINTGVRENFNLPRQHALMHYVLAIRLFGSPNGLCLSITESKHIEAVKRPWRRSSRHEPIGQILRTLARKSKLAALRAEFGRRGMLHGDVLATIQRELGDEDVEDVQAQRNALHLDALDAQAAGGDRAPAHISLSSVKGGTHRITSFTR